MLLETIKTEGLAHLSYVVGDGRSGTCAVIDPRRDVGVYLDVARTRNTRITHIIETHIHADFVSGSRGLAVQTGAAIYAGASDAYGFEVNALHDEDVLEQGTLQLRVLHTPGHSPEHICLAVKGGGKGAEHEWAVFTGDTLFAGEVGRPDLAGGTPPDELARSLYGSLHEKLLVLDDGVEVYPAHGEGSPCGGFIGVRDHTTVGYERRHNDKLQADSEAAFVKRVLENLPKEPFYYHRAKRVNAEGPGVLGDVPPLQPLTPLQFREALRKDNTLVLDTREIEAFAGAHIEGSLSIALRSSFPIWAGWMLEPEQRILLVLDRPEDAAVVQRQLLGIGVENLGGYLRQGMRGWTEAGLPFETSGRMSVHECYEHSRDDVELQVLDVRRDDEWQSGHISGAQHAFVPFLEESLDQLQLDKGKSLAVYCGSGYRSSIAVSVLKRQGFEDVRNILGSMSAWKAAGLPLEGG